MRIVAPVDACMFFLILPGVKSSVVLVEHYIRNIEYVFLAPLIERVTTISACTRARISCDMLLPLLSELHIKIFHNNMSCDLYVDSVAWGLWNNILCPPPVIPQYEHMLD